MKAQGIIRGSLRDAPHSYKGQGIIIRRSLRDASHSWLRDQAL